MTPEPSQKVEVAKLSQLTDSVPERARCASVDLVVVRRGERVFVLSGLCPHRRAHMAEGHLEGDSLVCESHGWDFDLETGRSPCLPGQALQSFRVWVDRQKDTVCVDEAELQSWRKAEAEPFREGEYLGA